VSLSLIKLTDDIAPNMQRQETPQKKMREMVRSASPQFNDLLLFQHQRKINKKWKKITIKKQELK
jgi:hypothetical protein